MMKMIDFTKTDIRVSGSNLDHTNIACIIENKIDFLDISIKESFSNILEEIKEVQDKNVKESLEIAHYYINQFFLNSKEEFLQLSRQSSCSLSKEPTSIQLQNIIKFWIILKYCNENIDMITIAKSSGKFEICGSSIWLFSPSKSVTTSIEKSIATIRHFLKLSKIDFIENGKCYISKITLIEDFNCSNCVNGSIEFGNSDEIIEDFVDGKKKIIKFKDNILQSDFINIQIEKNIKIQCGNCISDIEAVPNNISMLTK